MGKFWRLIWVFVFVLIFAQNSFAQGYKVLVLPDNIQFDSTNYYIFPDSAAMFATDTINELKKSGLIQTVSMTEVRDALRNNVKLNILTKKALKEYKYNYNIPFVDFKAIADYFGTDKILVITSQTDVQNYIFQRSIWDILNVPGTTAINPKYKMSTYVSLIDVQDEKIIWQANYYKKIGAVENRVMAQSFAPATQQLEKIKAYSMYFLAPIVANSTQMHILPKTDGDYSRFIPVSDKKLQQKPSVQNFPPLEPVVETKPSQKQPALPTFKIEPSDFGDVINDL